MVSMLNSESKRVSREEFETVSLPVAECIGLQVSLLILLLKSHCSLLHHLSEWIDACFLLITFCPALWDDRRIRNNLSPFITPIIFKKLWRPLMHELLWIMWQKGWFRNGFFYRLLCWHCTFDGALHRDLLRGLKWSCRLR